MSKRLTIFPGLMQGDALEAKVNPSRKAVLFSCCANELPFFKTESKSSLEKLSKWMQPQLDSKSQKKPAFFCSFQDPFGFLSPIFPKASLSSAFTRCVIKQNVRVLIAEDNLINQKIALKQIEKLGLEADAVMNVNAVLAALNEYSYSLVLMDCQMPELDGFETTKKIRTSQTLLNVNVPIIAMTANTTQQDREVCIAIGMNGYLSKPIRFEELKTAIWQWLEPSDMVN